MNKVKASDLWLEFLTPAGLCGLCDNKGLVMMNDRHLPSGQQPELRPCICPNGRCMVEVIKQRDYAAKNRPADLIFINTTPNVAGALEVIGTFGGIDGSHHKAWVIDQAVRHLTGVEYPVWVSKWKEGEDGPNTYEWDVGIAP